MSESYQEALVRIGKDEIMRLREQPLSLREVAERLGITAELVRMVESERR